VLLVLLDQMNQRILRSVLVVFRRIRLHQADYIREACNPEACRLAFAKWANNDHWSATMLVPCLDESLFQSATWARLSLTGVAGAAAVPLLGDPVADSEDERILATHVRLTMGALRHMMGYVRLPQSPPWSLIRLLYCKAGDRALGPILAELRAVWEITVHLETSQVPFHLELANQLPMTRWTVFREPLQLLERAGWDPSSPWYSLALSYIKAMWEGVTNTMGLENGFNDLRDNEIRGARHKARSDSTIHALAISSLTSRYKDTVEMAVVGPEDVGVGRWQCKAHIYRGEDAPVTAASIGVDPGGLVNDRAAWPSTNSDTFNQTQLALLRALTVTTSEAWPALWMARLLREHMLVTEVATGKVFYVLGCTKWTALMLELTVDGAKAWFTADPDAFHACVPVVSLEQFRCHDYGVLSESSHGGLRVGFHMYEGTSMLTYCCQHWLHLLQAKTLHQICAALLLKMPGNASQLVLSKAVLTSCAVSEEVRADMLERITAIMVKRSRKKNMRPSPGCVDTVEQGEEEEEGLDEDEEAHGSVVVPDTLIEMAGGEVAYMLSKGDASKAITEEETDEGMDKMSVGFAAAALAETDRAAKRPRKDKPSSSSGSSRDAIAPPPNEEPAADATEGVEIAGWEVEPDVPEGGASRLRTMRIPRADLMDTPDPRCTLSQYRYKGVAPMWKAVLPRGLYFDGKNSCSRSYRDDAGELIAKTTCYQWLRSAVAAGVLP
jgi:hypothetical protein